VVLPDSHGISRAPCYLGYHSRVKQISITGLSPCVAVLSRTFIYLNDFLLFEVVSATSEWSHNPITATSENYHADMVWPLPLSLANTNGIICYFLFLWVLRCFTSPRSLQLPYVFRQKWLDITPAGFPHSEILESKLYWQLLEAYRSLIRPSSVIDA
jgi:hypothetical protein